MLQSQGASSPSPAGSSFASFGGDGLPSATGGGVEVAGIVNDPTPPRMVYDPGNPDANAKGYVAMPNVNPVTEMTDLITATRAYEANATAIQAVKGEAQHALDILR
jgi:flagellar basal-body rod protein FlgC